MSKLSSNQLIKSTSSSLTIPFNYQPRPYQLPFWQTMATKKRAVLVWHRRAGKDKTVLNFMISRMFPENGGRIGTYYYLFPTYAQGKKILWDGIDRDGFKFMDHFPSPLVAGRNESELQVTLVNGSIFQIIGTDKMDSIVGTNPIGCAFSEYALQNPKAWDFIRPILRENGGWAVFPYTPRGHNHGKTLHDMARGNPEWFCQLLTVKDTEALGDADIESDRREGMVEELIQQEYYCSFEGYQEGSYYTKELQLALRENRITHVPYEKYFPVNTFWDLGIGDATGIWFGQFVAGERRFVEYYEASGEGLAHYAKVLSDRPYIYGRHYMPHDAAARELGTGKSRREVAEGLGIKPIDIMAPLPVDDGINAVRMMFPNSWFDKKGCERGLQALASYHKERDEERREFKNKPYHDWSSHAADAFRMAAISDFDRARPLGNALSGSSSFAKPKITVHTGPGNIFAR